MTETLITHITQAMQAQWGRRRRIEWSPERRRTWRRRTRLVWLARGTADAAMLALACLLALAAALIVSGLGFGDGSGAALSDLAVARAQRASPLIVGVIAYFYVRGHYTERMSMWFGFRDVCAALFVAMLVDGFLQYSLQQSPSRIAVGLAWPLAAPLVMIGRWLARRALDRAGLWAVPAMIVGDPGHAGEVRRTLEAHPEIGFEVQRCCSFEDFGRSMAEDAEPDPKPVIVLAMTSGDLAHNPAVMAELMRRESAFYFAPPLYGLPVFNLQSQYFLSSDLALFKFRNNLHRTEAQALKRATDIALGALALLALAPLMLAAYALVRLDGGPGFFAHRRVGRHGVHFGCLKFRTMVENADDALRRHLDADPQARREWEATSKLRDDPRVTRIGRLLRKTSIDELPQLLNVLRGEMSLVGPRPIVDREVPLYRDEIAHYLAVRPGVTGLWQVSGRSATSFDRRVALDAWYVKNWTLWHDFIILLLTPAAVLRSAEAH